MSKPYICLVKSITLASNDNISGRGLRIFARAPPASNPGSAPEDDALADLETLQNLKFTTVFYTHYSCVPLTAFTLHPHPSSAPSHTSP